MRKPRTFGRRALVVTLALVAATSPLALAGCNGSDAGDDAPAAEQPAEEQTEQPAEEQEPYTVSEEQLDGSNQFATYITGKLTNNTDDAVSYIQVEYNLYDAEGAQVGTALANTNNLQPGGVWKFEAIGNASPDEVASFELIDVTGF